MNCIDINIQILEKLFILTHLLFNQHRIDALETAEIILVIGLHLENLTLDYLGISIWIVLDGVYKSLAVEYNEFHNIDAADNLFESLSLGLLFISCSCIKAVLDIYLSLPL